MPNGCGLGGDAFWLIWDAGRRGGSTALNGSGRAPAAADAGAPRERAGSRPSRCAGPLSITVPGAVRSWGDAHARFGRLSGTRSSRPAIELAAGGFPAWDGFIDAVEGTAAARRGGDRSDRARFFEVYRPHGRAWHPGERVRLPALAATLGALADDGFDAFYEGDLGERQARGLAAAGVADHGAADLREHSVDLGRADRDRLPRRPRDHAPAQQLGRRRPRDARHPRPVRAAGPGARSGRTA